MCANYWWCLQFGSSLMFFFWRSEGEAVLVSYQICKAILAKCEAFLIKICSRHAAKFWISICDWMFWLILHWISGFLYSVSDFVIYTALYHINLLFIIHLVCVQRFSVFKLHLIDRQSSHAVKSTNCGSMWRLCRVNIGERNKTSCNVNSFVIIR